jgi:predicted nuclease of predicted toxin-antitoxin system
MQRTAGSPHVLAFLRDESAPKPLADWLERRGHRVVSLTELLPPGSPDDAVVAVAAREALIVLTCDQHFRDRQRHQQVAFLVLDIRPPQELIAIMERVVELIEAHSAWCQRNDHPFRATLTRNKYTVCR